MPTLFGSAIKRRKDPRFIHAPAEYRKHLATVIVRRTLEKALGRAK